MYNNRFYEEHKFDEHSKNGEDGVIKAILEKLGVETGWVCEVQTGDGTQATNTFALVKRGFQAVLIESDAKKFESLKKLAEAYPKVVPLCTRVDEKPESPDSIDKVLARTDITKDFVLLSVVVDGCDYQIWRSLEKYRPRIVVIEINSSVNPDDPNYIHQAVKHMHGTGFTPMLALGHSKGYQLLTHTGNMIFVRDEDAASLDVPSNPITCFRRNWQQ